MSRAYRPPADPAPYVPLTERARRAATEPAPPLDPEEVMRRFAIDRLGDVLELDEIDREWIFTESYPVAYEGNGASLILYFDEASTLDATGDEPELRVITGPDGAAFFHLLDACPGCCRQVPRFEFDSLAQLGAAQAALRAEPLGASARLSHIFAIRDNHAQNCPALAAALTPGAAR